MLKLTCVVNTGSWLIQYVSDFIFLLTFVLKILAEFLYIYLHIYTHYYSTQEEDPFQHFTKLPFLSPYLCLEVTAILTSIITN